jgi:hypothetical protein
MIRGKELKIPIIEISKFLSAVNKLPPRSGVIFLLAKHITVTAATIYMLNMNPKKDENLKALKVLGKETGKTNTNYK